MTAIINITPMGTLVSGGGGERAQLLRPIGASKNLSLTSTTARTTVPTATATGEEIIAYRIVALSGPCYIGAGGESIEAAAGDIAIPQNGEFFLPAKASITHISGIDV
jgi:hypothetical protein